MTETLQAQKPVHVVYGWLNQDGSYYFVSKALKDSPVISKDKKHSDSPENPEQIRIIKEFDQEEDALEFLDQLVYALGLESDGSGTVLNENANVKYLRVGNTTALPVSVYEVPSGQHLGDYASVVEASEALGINKNSAYACLRREHHAGEGKYLLMPLGEPYKPIKKKARRSRPRGNVHPSAKTCVAYTKGGEYLGEYGSYGECSHDLDISKESIRCMVNRKLYSSGN